MQTAPSPFCPTVRLRLLPTGRGVLDGLSFAAKDVFDVAGYVTGAGNPDWLNTHPAAKATASVIERMRAQGADLLGKTITDELAYSLNGDNAYYGTPLNPLARERIPGGSSSGSVSAVASGLVDLALGTDCGGSIRLPASYCGVYGIRTSHGRLADDNMVHLAPSFDTIGWFARDAAQLQLAGQALLFADTRALHNRRLVIAPDLFAVAGGAVQQALAPAIAQLAEHFDAVESIALQDGDLSRWQQAFRVLQAREIWALHGRWIKDVQPTFGPGVRERFDAASRVTQAEVDAAAPVRNEVRARLAALLDDGSVLCLPSAPGIAPLLNASRETFDDTRVRAMRLLCVAGLAGLPQISMPVASLDACPLGLSLAGAAGTDLALLELVAQLELALTGAGASPQARDTRNEHRRRA